MQYCIFRLINFKIFWNSMSYMFWITIQSHYIMHIWWNEGIFKIILNSPELTCFSKHFFKWCLFIYFKSLFNIIFFFTIIIKIYFYYIWYKYFYQNIIDICSNICTITLIIFNLIRIFIQPFFYFIFIVILSKYYNALINQIFNYFCSLFFPCLFP